MNDEQEKQKGPRAYEDQAQKTAKKLGLPTTGGEQVSERKETT